MIHQNNIQKLPNSKYRMLPGTWDFKIKWLPDGSPLKFKALYCVRGDKKSEGVDYFETYAPVFSWSTVHLDLNTIPSNG